MKFWKHILLFPSSGGLKVKNVVKESAVKVHMNKSSKLLLVEKVLFTLIFIYFVDKGIRQFQ